MDPILSQEELCRQVQVHLQSLRRAGVDWLPGGPALNWKSSTPPTPTLAAKPPVQPVAVAPSPSESLMPPISLLQEAPMANDASTLTLEKRVQGLQLLAQEVAKCTKCAQLCSTRTQTVFGSGQPGVELCFIGEAPGADEDAQGKPFVGAAGQLLTKIIEGCGLKREEVYICNILKCRPPGNRTPLPDEANNCRDFLERQIRLVQPKFICALGGCAASNLLGTTVPLGKLRGRFHDFQGIPVLVTYHPAYLLPHRNPDKKRDVWEDMKILLIKMGREIPVTKK
jgi:uracil-DNA glycosylase